MPLAAIIFNALDQVKHEFHQSGTELHFGQHKIDVEPVFKEQTIDVYLMVNLRRFHFLPLFSSKCSLPIFCPWNKNIFDPFMVRCTSFATRADVVLTEFHLFLFDT